MIKKAFLLQKPDFQALSDTEMKQTDEVYNMEIIHSDKVITVIRRGLNRIDSRLIDHGVKVMLVLQDMLKADGCQDETLLKNMSILALLHDVGAYRTEDINNLIKFEIGNVWEHSIYGYLFLREFTPLGEWAKIVLYHHADFCAMTDQPEQIRRCAQLLHTADRVVVWHDEVKRTVTELEKHFSLVKGKKFSPESIDLWNKCQKEGTFSKLDDPKYLDEALKCCLFDKEESIAYLMMVIYTIDFRSRDTVTHTIGVMEIGRQLARQMGLSEKICQQIYYGAMLHDLGKIGTPVSILERPGRLTPEEMAVMRHHVVLTGQILEGCVDEEIARIALRHHEKLDGSGYPLGLSAEELTVPERLLAVADITSALCMSRSYKDSYPKERCLGVLLDMCHSGKLDKNIVSVMETYFDEIIEKANEACKPLRDAYERIHTEYPSILKMHMPKDS